MQEPSVIAGSLAHVEMLDQGHAIRLSWQDGAEARFHALWLRDNALDPATRDPANGQRRITIDDIPANTIVDAVAIEGAELEVRFAPENKAARFDPQWLRQHIYDKQTPRIDGWLSNDVSIWDASLLTELPVANYAEARADSSVLADWLHAIQRYGCAMMAGLPTEDGSVCQIAELFGHVRETNYGRWFEVRSEIHPANLANTGLALQAHTDNPYRDPAPTLQLLACLENSAAGGESIVVDGFHAAQRLRMQQPQAYALLSGHCARFEYRGTGNVSLSAKKPMIEHGPDGELIAVRFNNRSAAPFTDIPYAEMPAYYEAYRAFSEIIESPGSKVSFRLAPGSMFIVDNTRVMHARSAFSGEGSRRLQGCYADKDGLRSTLTVLRKTND